MNVYKVGGCVRDQHLGYTPNDTDYVVVGSSVEELQTLGYKQVGIDFPVFLHPETGDEYALARTERKTRLGYSGFTVDTEDVTLEDDLFRRDLTINSMAEDLEGTLIDPYNGLQDLHDNILRHTSSAFKEDPIRVLRLARFKAKYPTFVVAPETQAIILTMKEELSALQPDRVWKEIEKVLALPNTDVFFETLLELGVLGDIFPNINALSTCLFTNPYHQEKSVFIHTMMVLRELKQASPLLKLTAIYHDIGKPLAYELSGGKHSGGHETMAADLIDMQIPAKLRKKVLLLIENHTRINILSEIKASKLIKFFKSYGRDEALLCDQIAFNEADKLGRVATTSPSKLPNWVVPLYCALTAYSPVKWMEDGDEPKAPQQIIAHIDSVNRCLVAKHRK